jgi:hypothetical protein
MASQAISVVTIKLSFGMAKGMELCMKEELLHITNVVRGEKFSSPPYKPHPKPLATLARFDSDVATRKFMQNIRQYNCLFAFTSMGARVDNSVNDGCGPPVFKISGQVHHRICSLLPLNDETPKFLQLYIYDTSNEVRNRL